MLIKRQITTWALIALALLLLLTRIAVNLYSFRRLQVADGFALLAFALLAANGVCVFSRLAITVHTRMGKPLAPIFAAPVIFRHLVVKLHSPKD